MNGGDLELPPGFRFHPTDEELVMHYLCRKCASLPISVPIITEIDLYKYDPWKLPGMASYGEKEWYFFSPRDRKYPNGSRPNRAAGSGYWKATGADKPIGNPKPIGIKKALVFYAGKAPRGLKTNWIMHEYRLADVDRSARKNNNSSRLDDWVLCRIYNKKGSIEKEFNADKKSTPSLIRNPEPTDQKPNQNTLVPQPLPSPLMNDFHYFDASDSLPKLHTESSCSEHVVSPEFKCEREVQSEPRIWRDWGKPLDIPFAAPTNSIDDVGSINNPYAQFDNTQLWPLQDMFMYINKPF